MARERQFYEYVASKVVVRTLLVLGVISFGFLAAENWVARWDLTEDQRFSISPASHAIAGSLADPLTIRAYFSERIPERVLPMQRQVFDILAEYEAHGNGRIKVERYDPLESTAAASEAQSYGVHPIQLRVFEATEASTLQVYGSIVLIYGDRASEVINIAERYGQGYDGLSALEYEITSKIWELTHEKPKIGITGYLERESRGNPFMGQQPPRPEFNTIRTQLGEAFEIEDVNLDQEEVDPGKIPLLLIIRPREMSDVALFRLDQYMMKGGRVLLFVTQGTIEQTPWGDRSFAYEPFKTGLDAWLEHHGLRVPNEFVLHWGNAVPIDVPLGVVETPFGPMQQIQPMPNWFWPLIGAEGSFDEHNPAVQRLKVITLWWAHPVEVLEGKLAGKQATVLIRSHESESWRWKDLRRIDRRFLSAEKDRPSASDFVSSPLAVAVGGTFTSYFADKPVPPSLAAKKPEGEGTEEGGEKPAGEGEKPEEGAAGEEKKEAGTALPEVVKQNASPTQLVVIGNSFFISDVLLGQADERSQAISSLALNLADWLARSQDLIALRAKRFTDRALVDETFQSRLKETFERERNGEIDAEESNRIIQSAEEEQKARRKRARWVNIIVPCFVILLAGAIVWVARAAGRSGAPRIPPAEPPASLKGEGSDA